jgi:hypothetical protein
MHNQNTSIKQAIKCAYPEPKSQTQLESNAQPQPQSQPQPEPEPEPEPGPQTRPLMTVRQFSEKHHAFSQGSLRNLIFLAESRKTSKGTIEGNGLNVALVRIGRKVLIDEEKFFQWVEKQQEGK